MYNKVQFIHASWCQVIPIGHVGLSLIAPDVHVWQEYALQVHLYANRMPALYNNKILSWTTGR